MSKCGLDVNGIRAGDAISTKWDDEEFPVAGVVERVYRGHRSKKFDVVMEDGIREVVEPHQITAVCQMPKS